MSKVSIERIGGLAGFGPGSRIRSTGEIDEAELSHEDQHSVAKLFNDAVAPPVPITDGFRYLLSRENGGQVQTVEVSEAMIPSALRESVHDKLI